MALLTGGLKEITERQDQLYRMIDTALFGRTYSVVSTDPDLVVEPAIEPFHALIVEDPASVLGQLQALLDAAAGDGDLDPEMLAKLAEIALVLA